MVTWDDVGRLVRRLPDTAERRPRAWTVHDRLFVWERPLGRKDREELRDGAPDAPPIAFRVADEGVKLALVAAEPDVFLTTAHFEGYPIVLARLDRIAAEELAELVEDAWLARAPRRLAEEYLSRPS